jgi:hypothetical protein
MRAIGPVVRLPIYIKIFLIFDLLLRYNFLAQKIYGR